MKEHNLKTWPEYFQALWDGNKTFEVRKDDRGFNVGDVLILEEYDHIKDMYLGRRILCEVSYKLSGGSFGIEQGFCVLGIKNMVRTTRLKNCNP